MPPRVPSPTALVKHLQEIHQEVSALVPAKDPVFIARYVGSVGHEKRQPDEQSALTFIGLTLPQIRKLAKYPFSFIGQYEASEQAAIWLALYHQSAVFEELTLSLIKLRHPTLWKYMLTQPDLIWGLQARVDNWAISDGVSDFVAALVEQNHTKYLPQMRRWNRSHNPWERRQSLVGLYFYARFRKNPIAVAFALPLVEACLKDKHYFVQKAVGWCLREIYRIDPSEQMKFVQRHVASLSAQAFATAIEKYSEAQKAKIKQARKKARI